MSESLTAEVQQLVQSGRAAALAGDTSAARASFRRATELDPSNAEAWIGLSSAVPILAEKRQLLQRALEIEPGSADARGGRKLRCPSSIAARSPLIRRSPGSG